MVLGRLPAEGAVPREGLVQHAAEREEVAAAVDGGPSRLLGRQVAHGSEHDAGARRRRERGVFRSSRGGRQILGQPEVQDLEAAVSRQKQVLGLQVPVDDARRVGGREPVGDRCAPLRDALAGDRAPPQPRAQRLALEQLGDHEGDALRLADVVEREHGGMVERRHRAGLALETTAAVRVACHVGGQDLEGDVAPEARVTRPVDLAHAAGAEGAQHLVRSQATSGCEGHVWGLSPRLQPHASASRAWP